MSLIRQACALIEDVRFVKKVGVGMVVEGLVVGPLELTGGAGVQGQVGREARYWLLMWAAEYLQSEVEACDASLAISSALSLPKMPLCDLTF
jgi:hypothetical protein